MFNRIKTWLDKPFPFYETFAEKLLVPLYISLFIIAFEIVFNPSNNTEIFSSQLLKILSYALITFLIASAANIWLPKLFSSFFQIENWKVWKMILFSIIKVLVISIANATYAFYVDIPGNNIFFPAFLLRVSLFTISIAFIPVVVTILWLEKRFYKKNYKIAMSASTKLESLKENNAAHDVFEYNGFKIELKRLSYIKSDGNYCSFFYENDNSMSKKLIRITLKEIEEQITAKDNFIRCHKSYIVNVQKIKKIVGNARQYNVYLEDSDILIPVSRVLSKPLFEQFNLAQ